MLYNNHYVVHLKLKIYIYIIKTEPSVWDLCWTLKSQALYYFFPSLVGQCLKDEFVPTKHLVICNPNRNCSAKLCPLSKSTSVVMWILTKCAEQPSLFKAHRHANLTYSFEQSGKKRQAIFQILTFHFPNWASCWKPFIPAFHPNHIPLANFFPLPSHRHPLCALQWHCLPATGLL